MLDKQHIIESAIPYNPNRCYICYLVKDGVIVYIGTTDCLSLRLKTHANNGKEFDSFFFKEIDYQTRYQIESIEILRHVPILNVNMPCKITVAKLRFFTHEVENIRHMNMCRFNGDVFYVSQYNGQSLIIENEGISESSALKEQVIRVYKNSYTVRLIYWLNGVRFRENVAEDVPNRHEAKSLYFKACVRKIQSINFQIA